MRRATGRSQAPRRPPDVETPPDRRPTRQIPRSARFPPSKRTENQRAPEEDVRRLRTTELVPRSVSLPGISSHGTGRAHQWLGAGPVAAVWPACLSLPSIVRMMAHNAPLSSANCTDSPSAGFWLVRAVTAATRETKRFKGVGARAVRRSVRGLVVVPRRLGEQTSHHAHCRGEWMNRVGQNVERCARLDGEHRLSDRIRGPAPR